MALAADPIDMPINMPMETSNDDGDSKKHHRRPAKDLPYELAQHCSIYFEEKLCKSDYPATFST